MTSLARRAKSATTPVPAEVTKTISTRARASRHVLGSSVVLLSGVLLHCAAPTSPPTGETSEALASQSAGGPTNAALRVAVGASGLAPATTSPADVGSPTPGCQYTKKLGPVGFSSSLGAGESVAKYVCAGSTCQAGGGAVATDSLSGSGALAAPVIQLIFWGSAWSNPATSPSAAQVQASLKTMVASTYFDGLRQYGVKSVTLDQTVFSSADPPSSYTYDDVKGEVFRNIDNSSIFSNRTNEWIYLVMMPPGTTPPPNACGSHNTGWEFNAGFQYNTANVGWAAFSDLDSMTATMSHELIEAMTDPDGGSGWLMNRAFAGGPNENEIGDACNVQEDFLDGVQVQSYFSDADSACIIPFGLPVLSTIAPASGKPGTTVTISGANLGPGSKVTFGGVAGINPVCTATSCTVTVPGNAGFGQVSVAVNDGEASGARGFCIAEPSCTFGQCGTVSDGCGGSLQCGGCGAGQQCGGPTGGASPTAVYVPNVCVPTCTPIGTGTIVSSTECGQVNDWCGGTVLAGCESGQQCVSGVCEGTPGSTGVTCGNNVCAAGDTCVNGVCQGVNFGTCHTAKQCCLQNGGTWSGGRCS